MAPSDPENPITPLRPVSDVELNICVPVSNPLRGISWDFVSLTDHDGNLIGALNSSSIGPKHWSYIAGVIRKAYSSYDGFVILHGTDTMAYTASALSFLFRNLSKPVVITGSQLPILEPRTDAVMNFVNALSIAGYIATGLPRVPEVVVCFGDTLLRGNRTVKVSNSRWRGFVSPNYPSIGQIGEQIIIHRSLLLPEPVTNAKFIADTVMEENVATIAIYPGMDTIVLEKMFGLEVKGFILRTFGAGNVPESERFVSALRDAVCAGKIVVNTTQCLQGSVVMGLYAGSFELQNAGVITGLDLTSEAALTKLMWLLGTETVNEAALQMQICQRGEQSGSVFDVRYGRVGERDLPLEIVTLSQFPPGQFEIRRLRPRCYAWSVSDLPMLIWATR